MRTDLHTVGVTKAGFGRHMIVVEETDPHAVLAFLKILLAEPIIYFVAVCFSKLALLLVFARVFTRGFERVCTYIVIAIVVATAISDVAASFAECIPLKKVWEPTVAGHCFSVTKFVQYGTLPNAISDFIMLLLPLRTVWKLQMPLRDKIGILATFMTGSL
ncbi:hypothetical protein ANO11243_096030 [Dothideomycetidae sp. 11243]|nr:hypothetical protein ANO11243_096030 [fungal sp. No.11243]